jgi:sortase A
MLLLAGFAFLGWWGWVQASIIVDQSWSGYEFEAELRSEIPSIKGYIDHLINERDAQRAEKDTPAEEERRARAPSQPTPKAPPSLSVGDTIGKLEIPRLHISGIVRHGMDDKTLERAIGHIPGTPAPGNGGNVGIAAHRDTFFRNLKGVKAGDRIIVETRSGTYEYAVDSTKIVMPENVEVLDPTADPAMTLVTCYPFNYIGHAPKRFIVRARQVKGPEVASVEKAPDAQAASNSGG